MHKHSSFVMLDNNPLESGILSDHVIIKAENLNDARLITDEEFENLYTRLAAIEENESRIELLETEKHPYLFNSEHLAKFVQIPESIRTKINFITIVGPRLVDPRVKMDYFIGLFRYAEEKGIVEEVLKNRTQTINAAMFTKVSTGAGGIGGRSGNRCGPLSSGRGAGNFHKRGTSDIASITGSISDSDELKPSAAATLDPHQLSLLSKSRSDPSFEGGDDGALLHFKSADPLRLSGTKSLHGTDSPCSITSRLSAPDNSDDLEVEKINAPIQPITISARAPMAVKGSSSSKESKRSAMSNTVSPASGSSSGRYSSGGSRPGTASELMVDEIDLAAAPSAATLKKLNRRLPSSNSLSAMLAAEAAASNNSQMVSGAAVTATMSLKSDGDDDVVNSVWISRKSGSADGQSTSSVEIGKGTVEKLRNSFAGIGSSPAGVTASAKSVSEDGSSSPLKDPSLPRPPKARWTQSISSASATMAVTALTSPGVRPDVIVRRFSSTVPRSYCSEDGIASSASAATGASASPSVSNDIANRCAAVLKIDKAAFLALTPEGPKQSGGGGGGEECYSFVELVRRNFTKEYEGLIQSDLEKYLVEDEFFKVFQKDKAQFYAQPRWKQMEQKKKSMLF